MMTGLAQTKKFPRNFNMMSTHQLLSEDTDQLMMRVYGQCGRLYPLDVSHAIANLLDCYSKYILIVYFVIIISS